MASLFDPGTIGTMTLRNRLIKSATFESMSTPDGKCTEELRGYHRRLAAGGVGLTIVAYGVVHPTGFGFPQMTSLDQDEVIPGFKKLTEQVHEEGGKVAMQLNHAGRSTTVDFIGEKPIGPSAVPDKFLRTRPRAMTEEEIEMLIDAFAAAAVRCQKAGFDAVQIHCAHGYLISQFLSPVSNQRDDKWGGSLENRQRFALEVVRRVRSVVGEDYPVFVKLNSEDYLEGGFTLEESIDTCQRLEEAGVDAIELSGGFIESIFFICRGDIPIDLVGRGMSTAKRIATQTMAEAMKDLVRLENEAYFLPAAREAAQAVDIPIISVGGMRSLAVMEDIIQNEPVEFISLARPLIREPDLPNKFKRGESEEATCVSCNRCLLEMAVGNPLRCYYTG